MAVYSKKRKDGSTAWFYDFMLSGVRYRGVAGSTKTQAMRAQEKIRTKVLGGKYELENDIKNPKIEEFAKVYLQRREHIRSRKRDELSVKTLLSFFEGKYLASIGPSLIQDYIVKRRGEKVANSTINRELACLKCMLNLAVKWGDTLTNPMKQVDLLEEPPGRTRYLHQDEATILLEHCNNSYLKPIVFTALNTGMRLGEILSLK